MLLSSSNRTYPPFPLLLYFPWLCVWDVCYIIFCYLLHIHSGKPGICFHYYCAVYDECKKSDTFCLEDRIRFFVHYTMPLSSLCKLIWRHWTYIMPVIYIYTLSYYHHQIGSMNYYPLFRIGSGNNGVRCMSFCILIKISFAIYSINKFMTIASLYSAFMYGVVHYNNVIMTTVVCQITSLKIVYSIVYSGADQRNIKASRHWPLCGDFTGTGEFPAQRASYAENASIWWRHHVYTTYCPFFHDCKNSGLQWFKSIWFMKKYMHLDNADTITLKTNACNLYVTYNKRSTRNNGQ